MGDVNITFDANKFMNAANRVAADAQKKLGVQVLQDSNVYTPFNKGALRNSGKTSSSGDAVMWGGGKVPYGKKLYFGEGMQIKTGKNPNARPRWAEYAASVMYDKWLILIGNVFRKGV
jgi:hypothetical protein